MPSAIRRCLAVIGLSVATTGAASGQPVGASFIDGAIGAEGFPQPLINNVGVMTVTGGSGGGSTGDGLGNAIATAAITTLLDSTRLRISGSSSHGQNSNGGYTSAYSQAALVFELTEAANYSITNSSSITSFTTGSAPLNPVILTELTGMIVGDAVSGMLSSGTYQLRFAVMAGYQDVFPLANSNYSGYQGLPLNDNGSSNYFFSASVDWRLDLTAVPAPSSAVLLGTMLLVGARRRR